MVRKLELKDQIKVNQQTINALVRQNDLLMVAGNEQREVLAETRQQLAMYETAFHNAAGRLAAHNGISADEVGEYANDLLRSIILSEVATN